MDSIFLQARIDAAKAQVVAYEAAIDALVAGGVQSYSLDTGQSKQTVTRVDLARLHAAVDSLLNRIATLQARLNGSGVLIGRPGF